MKTKDPLIVIHRRRPLPDELLLSPEPLGGRMCRVPHLGVDAGTAKAKRDRGTETRPRYKRLQTSQTLGRKWAVVTLDSVLSRQSSELPPGTDRLAPRLAERLEEACDLLDSIGFHTAAFDVHPRGTLPQSVAAAFEPPVGSQVFVNEPAVADYSCAVIADRARIQRVYGGVKADELIMYDGATGLIIVPTDQRSGPGRASSGFNLGYVRLFALSSELRPEMLHEVFHAAQRAAMPEFYRIRATSRAFSAWLWLTEGTATAVELYHTLHGARGDFGSHLRAALRLDTSTPNNYWRDWFQPIDFWGTDNPHYAVGAMFLAADHGSIGYLAVLLARLNRDLEGLDEFPVNRYAAVHDALLRRGPAPAIIPSFVGAMPTRGQRPVLRGLAAMYARAIVACGRYDLAVPDAENAAVNRGALDGFRRRLEASSLRDVRGEQIDAPLYNMSTDGRAYHYEGADPGAWVGVRVSLAPNWPSHLYVLVGEADASELLLTCANSPGAVIEVPWVPTERRPLVVSIMHIDIVGGPNAGRLSWQYVVEMY